MFKPTDSGMVVYRQYFLSGFDPEYITIFRGHVVCSVNPTTIQCVSGGVRLKSVDELRRMTKLFLEPISNKHTVDDDYKRHFLNGKNYNRAIEILEARK